MTMQTTMNINSPIANKTSKIKQEITKIHQSTVVKCKVIPQYMKVSNLQKMCPNPWSTPNSQKSVKFAVG